MNWLPTAWFIVLGLLLIGYAVLDGFDLGIGTLHFVLGRSDAERRSSLKVIGPFWFGYEVWLLVAGGSMVAAFPRLYAASFSGFYLVLMLVLWLLIGRGTAIEFRSQVADPLWRGFWDFAFCGTSLLLAVLFGAAVGNVVRGVPLDATGNFQGSLALALNPFAIAVGLLSAALLAMHGAHYLAWKTNGSQQALARLWAKRLFPAVVVLSALATVFAFFVRSDLAANFARDPLLLILPALAVASLAAIFLYQRQAKDALAVGAGSVFLAALMGSAGASLYPLLLPDLGHPGQGLSILNAASPPHTLETALAVNLVMMSIVIAYNIYIHRVFQGPLPPNLSEQVGTE
jgi:cytochrome d ubiquinol oxidase subunit II